MGAGRRRPAPGVFGSVYLRGFMTWQDIIKLHLAGSRRDTPETVVLPPSHLPEGLSALAERMKVTLDPQGPVEIAPCWLGARALPALVAGHGNRIRLGGLLARRLSAPALDAVMAHELAHLKCRHWELLLLAAMLAGLGGTAIALAVDASLAMRLVLGGLVPLVAAAALSWVAEYEADQVAAQYVGYDSVMLMLGELRDSGFRRRAEFTHPPDVQRLKRLVATHLRGRNLL
jgi:Zn-dependent protease with chaperone function